MSTPSNPTPSTRAPSPVTTERSPDRLLPSEPRTRGIARQLYELVQFAPIISPHGHVSPRLLLDDRPYANATELLIEGDHYVTRLLHALGVDPSELAYDGADDPRATWRAFASNWHRFAGTASGYWIAEELSSVLGVSTPLGANTADEVYDEIGAKLASPEFHPRALLESFDIEVLATTDDPLDDLAAHDRLAELGLGRIVPTFRPDRYIDPSTPGFADNVRRLLEATGEPETFPGYLSALETRRAHFIRHGAVSADHGVISPYTVDLAPQEAERLFQRLLGGADDGADTVVFGGHMLLQMARMSVDDGLVMTVHPGVLRNHSTATLERFGPDTGHDIPVATTYTRALRPLLEKYGLERGLHLILFTVDETTYSREIAPLAGFYPSVYIGAPWWFLDAPESMARFRSAVTETAGFYRGSGFIDDTRALLSIPARHDTARRVDSAYLAKLVVEGRVGMADAEIIATDLVGAIPKNAFRL